ncbi:hypothetical protein ABZ835_41340 [Streptomyces sp. NPDC047461]|uniref:hypothetical protein n=1 Tax=Streptomyces sp. NPDC047461 TaxID=3155619 RepID=UPI00340AC970
MRRAALAVQEAAERTKLWWAADAAMAAFGRWRGRTAAAAGVGAMTTAQALSNAIVKPLYRRRTTSYGTDPGPGPTLCRAYALGQFSGLPQSSAHVPST